MKNALVVTALLILGACTTAPPAAPPAEPAPQAACGAADLQHLVRQPQFVLASMTFPSSTRFIGPDTAVTMDYNPERLNIRYEQDVIVEVYCG